eukprot:jgi/Hompol1/3180/HPOL_006418-RA
MAINMAQMLGMHSEIKYPVVVSDNERELRRSLWWVLYQADRESAIPGNVPCAVESSSPFHVPYPNLSRFSYELRTDGPDVTLQFAPPNFTAEQCQLIALSYSKYMELLTIISRTFQLLLRETDLSLSGDLVHMHSVITAQRNALDSDLNA